MQLPDVQFTKFLGTSDPRSALSSDSDAQQYQAMLPNSGEHFCPINQAMKPAETCIKLTPSLAGVFHVALQGPS